MEENVIRQISTENGTIPTVKSGSSAPKSIDSPQTFATEQTSCSDTNEDEFTCKSPASSGKLRRYLGNPLTGMVKPISRLVQLPITKFFKPKKKGGSDLVGRDHKPTEFLKPSTSGHLKEPEIIDLSEEDRVEYCEPLQCQGKETIHSKPLQLSRSPVLKSPEEVTQLRRYVNDEYASSNDPESSSLSSVSATHSILTPSSSSNSEIPVDESPQTSRDLVFAPLRTPYEAGKKYGSTVHIYDGYAYKSDGPPRGKKNTLYLSCIKQKRKGKPGSFSCLGRVIKYQDGRMKFKPHDRCKPIPYLALRRDFHQALCEAAKSESGYLKDIYTRLALQEDPTGVRPDVKFDCKKIITGGKSMLLIWDVEMAKKVKEEKGEIGHIDCTYQARIKVTGLLQLLTFMIRLYNGVYAFAWALMPSKKKETYVDLFEEMDITLEIELRKGLADFEQALQDALKQVFGIIVIGCFFHWCQAIWRYAVGLGIAYPCMSRKDPEKYLVIKQLMALALLPEKLIRPTYDELKKDVMKKFGNHFNHLFSYMENYWFKIRKEASFCCFGETIKVNNAIECHHRDLNHLFRHRRPSAWFYFTQMLELQQMKHIELDQSKEGFSNKPRNKVSEFNENWLRQAWIDVSSEGSDRLLPRHFLVQAANTLKRFNAPYEDETLHETEEDDYHENDDRGDQNLEFLYSTTYP
ncbi:hypothetical protein QAD02_013036 [Eretmocerus hayati]|uniref:Uncharacterized protein n=1 Tax=Eretmocerus hayati TaxID=131215 RepID=A0ACC2P1P6_9HYME|nr:hypothetical protein QAD02_013036 [Eretmocerus hayati]